MTFWDARFLWGEPMLASVLAAALLGYLGFFVVLRRMAFMSAALSQVSGLGVAVAFWVGSLMNVEPHSPTPAVLSPSTFAFAFAALGAMAMAATPRTRRVTPESLVALLYLGASAGVMVVLASPRIAQEAHEVGDLLFGNAVVVRHEDVIELAVVALLTFGLHGLFFKEFLFASFDPDTAKVFGVPVKRMELLLLASLALCIAVATRALGALPVFGFLVLPAGAAMLLSERLRPVLTLSVVIAVLSAAAGYYVSWTLSLPTGPVMVSLAVSVWALAAVNQFINKRR